MCLGIPMQVMAINGLSARCRAGDREEDIDLSLTGPVAPGTWVLVFLGAAREELDAERAALITAAIGAVEAAMSGRDPGDAFIDLETREPCLPPHLEAARRAGATKA